jgi:hypothetical protein
VDRTLITSVLGFDLKAEIVDHNGEPIGKGFIKGAVPKRAKKIKQRIFDKTFFTHYNEELLAKIRDLRKYD